MKMAHLLPNNEVKSLSEGRVLKGSILTGLSFVCEVSGVEILRLRSIFESGRNTLKYTAPIMATRVETLHRKK